MIVFLKEFFEKVNFEKSQQMTNYPDCKELNEKSCVVCNVAKAISVIE